MKKGILDRYTETPDNKLIIEIAARKVEDLYNDFDRHAPYRMKELDQELVDYLIDSVREIGGREFIIQFRFAEAVDMRLLARVKESIQRYFQYLRQLELRELAKMARTSLVFLLIGVAILFLAVWVNQKIKGHESVLVNVFAEGLTVAAWVSLWNALAAFLVDWIPHLGQIKRFDRIARATMLLDVGQQDEAALID